MCSTDVASCSCVPFCQALPAQNDFQWHQCGKSCIGGCWVFGIKVDESDGCHWHIVARGQSGKSGDIWELCQDVWWTDIINFATWYLKALTGQSGESGDIWELCQDVWRTAIIKSAAAVNWSKWRRWRYFRTLSGCPQALKAHFTSPIDHSTCDANAFSFL